MNIQEIKQIDECIYEFDHKSGLHVQVIPKKGFYKKFAVFAVNFGSINTKFILPGDSNITQVPEGVAHFLEHQLFEQPDGNITDKYVALGASPNAATGFFNTYYHFMCTENFDECFKLLLHFVLNPCITDKSAEKEKGIICQEINMYKDSPEYIVAMNSLNLLYHNNPIKNDIAGTVESVTATTAEMLNLCHETFYHPSNMVVTVVGDINPDDIEKTVNELVPDYKYKGEVERVFENEPREIKEKNSQVSMDVALPLFNIVFKDYVDGMNGKQRVYREVAGSIVKEMLFGRTSEFFETLYNEGLINQEFYADYDVEPTFAMASISGESPNPYEVAERIKKHLQKCDTMGLKREDFETVRNAQEGRMIKRFNSPESLGRMFATCYLQDIKAFDYFTAYGKIDYNDVCSVFKEIYLGEMAISVVMPKEI